MLSLWCFFFVFFLFVFALQVHTLDLRESTKRTCTSLRSLQGLGRIPARQLPDKPTVRVNMRGPK